MAREPNVDEYVLAATIASDEAEAFLDIEKMARPMPRTGVR
jgi:hypothetical protein